jgi:hypothetical protein
LPSWRVGGAEGDAVEAGAVHGFQRHLHMLFADDPGIAHAVRGMAKIGCE